MSEATAAQIERREPLMKIRGLTKEFKIKSRKLGAKPQILHALSDVSLDVYEGETLGIIGESGCGKSTLGRTIIQLHKATAGTVEYQGRNIFELKGAELKALKKDIQMVFQDPLASFNPKMKVMDILTEPLRNFGRLKRADREAKARELLRMVELPEDFVYRYPHSMSGGQRQREPRLPEQPDRVHTGRGHRLHRHRHSHAGSAERGLHRPAGLRRCILGGADEHQRFDKQFYRELYPARGPAVRRGAQKLNVGRTVLWPPHLAFGTTWHFSCRGRRPRRPATAP